MSTAITAPRPNMMIGITHMPDGRAIIREPKVLKVGIGLPRGKACDIYVNADGKWVIRMGKKGGDGKLKFETVATVATRVEAESIYRKAWKMADICLYPRKVPYFVFTRPVIGEDGGEIYVPDFQAIEAHSFADKKNPGPPTEIDIFFLDDNPFTGGYAMWSASQLKCSGDGENAMRVLDMASTAEEKELAKAAAAAGKRTFPVISGCWTCNCPYSKEAGNKPAPCKPSAEIRFQLLRSIVRIGGTAFFRTSSFRTIPQLFSGIERIKELTGGRVAGIPLKLVVRSHKTNHNNQPAIQQNVAVEFRAEDMDSLRKNLIEQAWKFRAAAGIAAPPPMMLAAPEEPDIVEAEGQSAQAMADEFYPDGEVDEAETVEVSPPPPAAIATQAKQAEIAEKLKQQREAQAPPATVEPVASADAPPAPPQWHLIGDRPTMSATMVLEKGRVGDAAFAAVLKKHDVIMGSLKPSDPAALAVYNELRALPKEDPF